MVKPKPKAPRAKLASLPQTPSAKTHILEMLPKPARARRSRSVPSLSRLNAKANANADHIMHLARLNPGNSQANLPSKRARLSIPSKIRQRQIYWLDDCEPLDGVDEKDRPVIVLATAEMLRGNGPVLIVACTTHPRRHDDRRFRIPSRHEASETGLPHERRCTQMVFADQSVSPHHH